MSPKQRGWLLLAAGFSVLGMMSYLAFLGMDHEPFAVLPRLAVIVCGQLLVFAGLLSIPNQA